MDNQVIQNEDLVSREVVDNVLIEPNRLGAVEPKANEQKNVGTSKKKVAKPTAKKAVSRRKR